MTWATSRVENLGKVLEFFFRDNTAVTIGVLAGTCAGVIPGYLYLKKLDAQGKQVQANRIRLSLKILGLLVAAVLILWVYWWVQSTA